METSKNVASVWFGIFDINPVLEGISVRGIEIRMINSLPEFIRENPGGDCYFNPAEE